jgi:hypothetical protein
MSGLGVQGVPSLFTPPTSPSQKTTPHTESISSSPSGTPVTESSEIRHVDSSSEANLNANTESSHTTGNPDADRERKTLGYKEFTNFVASDETLFMVRRFNTLNVRAALLLQDELVQLEDELKELDLYNIEGFPEKFDNGSFRKDKDEIRRDLIKKELIPKLKEYSKFHNRSPPNHRHELISQMILSIVVPNLGGDHLPKVKSEAR